MSDIVVIGPIAYFNLLRERNLVPEDAIVINSVDGPDAIRDKDVFGTVPRLVWMQHARSVTEIQWNRPSHLRKKNWRCMSLDEMRRCAGPALKFTPPMLKESEDGLYGWNQIVDDFDEGTIIENALIVDVRYYGLKIEIEDNLTALLHISELEKVHPHLTDKTNKERVKLIEELYGVGDTIEVEIREVVNDEQRIHLTFPVEDVVAQ